MKVVGYVRVSTEEQGKGASLEAQAQKIRDYCKLYELDLVCIFQDKASGKSMKRKGLLAVFTELKQNADGVIVAKLDRLTRSVRDLGSMLEEFFGSKYQLFSVAEQIDTRSAAGRLVLHILVSVAQWERETTSERTRDVKKHQKKNGAFLGGHVPYGYMLNVKGQLVVNIDEVKAMQEAKSLRERGGRMSLRKIGEELLKRGHRPRTGKKWGPQQVKCLLAAE